MEDVLFDRVVADPLRTLLADAQTSGGLLMAVPPERVDDLVAELRACAPAAAVVGEVVEGRAGSIAVL
jgi:selenide,water dikinase